MKAVIFLALFLTTSLSYAADRYEDLGQYLFNKLESGQTPARWHEFRALTQRLNSDFDNDCGDVWCEGRFSNWQSLGIQCVVETASETVKSCTWGFAGQSLELDPNTGKYSVSDKDVVQCEVPINASIDALLKLKGTSDSLPGTSSDGGLFYDALNGCL